MNPVALKKGSLTMVLMRGARAMHGLRRSPRLLGPGGTLLPLALTRDACMVRGLPASLRTLPLVLTSELCGIIVPRAPPLSPRAPASGPPPPPVLTRVS
ncbi:hypothetical protein FKM82_023097 [Ascaphus truei]